MMSSQSCIVPKWNLRNQRQVLVEAEKANAAAGAGQEQEQDQDQDQEQVVNIPISTHLRQQQQQQHQNSTHHPLVPMFNYEVAELTWENGQLAMHGVGGVLPTAMAQTTKPAAATWGRTGDTLESIVHLATTCHNQAPQSNHRVLQQQHAHDHPNYLNAGKMSSMAASSSGKWGDSSANHVQVSPSFLKKRVHSAPNIECSRRNVVSVQDHQERHPDISACASVSATMSKDNDTTMMTWPSFESPNWSFKSKTSDDDASENQEEECKLNEGQTVRSHSTRRSRAAAVHNQSERRRRDRINQKMKALQKLVPNASKTDKASMLDEVIGYLKQLQAQVQIMNSVRSMPAAQMMLPLQMQQQQLLQMSLVGRMGMGVGLGMGMGMMPQSLPSALIPQNHVAHTATPFVQPHQFVMPQMIPAAGHAAASQVRNNGPTANTTPVPFNDPYSAFLAQSMNMDLYSKMATLYRQQVSQAAQTMASPSQSKGD